MIPVNSENNCSVTDSPFTDFPFFLMVSGDYCCRNFLGGTVSTCFPTNKRTQAGCLSSWNQGLLGPLVKIRSIPLGHSSQRKTTLIPYLKTIFFFFLFLSSACPDAK